MFAPRPRLSAEGDGYLITNIFDEAPGVSHLAIFDASGLEAGPIARAPRRHRVPMGFHGLWMAA